MRKIQLHALQKGRSHQKKKEQYIILNFQPIRLSLVISLVSYLVEDL